MRGTSSRDDADERDTEQQHRSDHVEERIFDGVSNHPVERGFIESGLVSLVLPPLFFLPLAIARQWGTPLRIAFVTGLLLSPVPAVLALAPHTGMIPVSGSLALRYVPWGLVVAVIGILAYAAGYRLVAIERERVG